METCAAHALMILRITTTFSTTRAWMARGAGADHGRSLALSCSPVPQVVSQSIGRWSITPGHQATLPQRGAISNDTFGVCTLLTLPRRAPDRREEKFVRLGCRRTFWQVYRRSSQTISGASAANPAVVLKFVLSLSWQADGLDQSADVTESY